MVVVDSSVWIANLRSQHDAAAVRRLRDVIERDEVVVGDLVLLEVLRGARDDAQAARIERDMRRFRVEPMLGDAVAVAAARLYRDLRGRGITIRKTADLVIAAFCLAHGYRLLHRDRDFAPFATHCGLRVVA